MQRLSRQLIDVRRSAHVRSRVCLQLLAASIDLWHNLMAVISNACIAYKLERVNKN